MNLITDTFAEIRNMKFRKVLSLTNISKVYPLRS